MAERSKLSALLTGVMSAVQKAATTAGQQNLYLLDQYFHADKDGNRLPIYTRIETASGKVMDVPLICLINPAGYRLDELEMDLSIKLTLAEVKKAVHDYVSNNTMKKGSYAVELCPKDSKRNVRPDDVVDVKIKFKASETPEGLSRIIETLDNTINVVPKNTAPDDRYITGRVAASEIDTGSDVWDEADTEVISPDDLDTPFPNETDPGLEQ